MRNNTFRDLRASAVLFLDGGCGAYEVNSGSDQHVPCPPHRPRTVIILGSVSMCEIADVRPIWKSRIPELCWDLGFRIGRAEMGHHV